MGLHLSSAWRTPRGWRLIIVTLAALTLLLVIPLHQLSDDTPGLYGHLTKYLSHEGAAYDVEEGFVANLNETTTDQILNDKKPAEKISYDTDSPQYTGENGKQIPNRPKEPVEPQQSPGIEKPEDDEDDGSLLEIDHGTDDELQHNEQVHSEVSSETSKPESSETNLTKPQVDEHESQGDAVKPQEDMDKHKSETDEHKPESKENKPQADEKKLQSEEKTPKDGKDKSQEGGDKKLEGIEMSDNAQTHNDHHDENGDSATKIIAYEDSATTSFASEFTPSQTAELDVPSGPLSNWTGVCDGFPNTDGIMLVMKTGATEAFTKLPAHLLTSLQCLDDYLLFSDLVSS
jgi:hypothetical protein